MKIEEAMNQISRKLLTVTAAASLVTLTACGQSIENPPALSEIEDAMWESMQQEESVTITADIEALSESVSDEGDMFTEMLGSDATEVKIYGDLDGSTTGMSIGGEDLMRVFEQQEAYFAGDVIFNLFGGQDLGLGGAEQEIFDSMSEEFANTWIDVSSELGAEADEFNIGSLLTSLEDGWKGDSESDDSPVRRDEISDQGSHEVRDEQDVWVYQGSEEGQELVLEANFDAPKIVAIADGENLMNFSDWSATEGPQRPDESEVIDEAEFEERMMQSILGGGM